MATQLIERFLQNNLFSSLKSRKVVYCGFNPKNCDALTDAFKDDISIFCGNTPLEWFFAPFNALNYAHSL